MKLQSDEAKERFLLTQFRKSDLPPVVAAARRIYEDHVSALAALHLARKLGLGVDGRAARAAATRKADAARKRWWRCRKKIKLYAS